MTAGRAFPWKAYLWSLAGLLLFASAPLLGGFLASVIASAHDCRLNEATVHSCVVLGIDLGGMLYVLFVMTWFGLVTLPLGAMALTGWIVVLVLHLIRRWLQSRA